MSFVQHRPVEGEARRVTAPKEADGWYVSVLPKREVETPAPVAGDPVGGDLGRFTPPLDGRGVLGTVVHAW